jgi:hypothetical protein
MKYNRLTVLETYRENGILTCNCICDCGKLHKARLGNLKSGGVKSCGCLAIERASAMNRTHGMTKGHQTWNSWGKMRQRCLNPKNKDYHNYGGRGIAICEEWNDYKVFYEWSIANGWAKGLSIDRRRNNEGYNPDNCRWVNHSVNNRNKRNSIMLTFNDETIDLSDMAEKYGLTPHNLWQRLYRLNWTLEKALMQPIRVW